MISINTDEQVIVKYKEKEYCLKKSEEYQKFVLLITNPKITLEKDIFEFDKTITDARWISIFVKYKEFFESFLNSKAEVIKAAEKQVEDQLPKEEVNKT